jgi:hypothetical protein
MLSDVIINGANNGMSGGFGAFLMIAYGVYLDAKKIGTMARCFPWAIFTVGADAAT